MISVIVPLYKGNEYVDGIIRMIIDNAAYINEFYSEKIEIVFVNDYPEERIKEIPTLNSSVSIIVKERTANGGIHRARLDGLGLAKGDYIVFLDQDDEVKKNWLKCLFECSVKNNATVVVCNGWRERYSVLSDMDSLRDAINDVNFYLDRGNAIVSPGQVLIKKEIIPIEWIENVKNKNGCDDHLLWLLLKKKGIDFSLCEEYLYFHNPKRHEYSISQRKFYESYLENIEILDKTVVISSSEHSRMEIMAERFNESEGSRVSPSELVYRLYRLKIRGISVCDYFYIHNVRSVAIYGLGKLGIILAEEIETSKYNVAYYIDKNAVDFYEKKAIYRITDDFPYSDLIIDTTVDGINTNEKNILLNKGIRLIRLHNIVAECEVRNDEGRACIHSGSGF